METNYNFQDIWKQKEVTAPDSKSIIKKANSYKKNQMLFSIFLSIQLLATIGVISWIWISLSHLYFFTKAGLMMILLALIFFSFLNLQKINILNKINPSLSNQDYLKKMKSLQQKQIYMQTTGLNIYFILLFLGMCFYMLEFVQRMTPFWGIIFFSTVLGWMFFVWFYIKPVRRKKQEQKMKEVIQSLESLERGFEE
ncbi:hypothetical protein [Epilithonimonas hungarica]|uniref:Uncharacterized protein n=1 Tax=Epilithonimonas hungarica TaxID=454006 RepID=A0A1G7PYM5_9FLAO|nr:hypothetical protein [Epilithonimonas hungarica]SDF91402.1 hypothetical protein SAMN05421825_2458 [Epilithonimonas hungarica]